MTDSMTDPHQEAAALVRAEAGVSAAVEALADVRARRSTFATAEAFDSAMLEAAWNILAARGGRLVPRRPGGTPMTDPTTPRPDPVTEARDALVRLHERGDYFEEGWSPSDDGHECRACGAWCDAPAKVDNLIALARAEAGVSVEALAKAMRQAMYLEPGFRDHPQPDEAYPDLARGVITILAARSAKEDDHG